MADGNQPNRARATALQAYDLKLTTAPTDGATRNPSLGFQVRKNNPQIVVRTQVPNDKEFGKITAQMTAPDLHALAALIERVANGPAGKKEVMKNLARRFINGKRSDPMPDTLIHVGKDEKGVVWIAVQSWDKSRPLIRFPFGPTEMTQLLHEDGTNWGLDEVSQVYATGWVTIIRSIVSHVVVNEYVEPPPRDNGQGGGGYNNGGNRGGGGGWGGNNQGGGGGGGWNNNGGGGNSGGGGGSGGDWGGGGGMDKFPM